MLPSTELQDDQKLGNSTLDFKHIILHQHYINRLFQKTSFLQKLIYRENHKCSFQMTKFINNKSKNRWRLIKL